MYMIRAACLGLLGCILLPAVVVADEIPYGKMYWTNRWRIQRGNLDGTEIETLVDGQNTPAGLALDLTNGLMYWTDIGRSVIKRANLDGSNVERIARWVLSPYEVVLDLPTEKMYWTDRIEAEIWRANLDGSAQERILGGYSAWGLALDPGEEKMYWTGGYARGIYRANLDGSGIETLVSPDYDSRDTMRIALDLPPVRCTGQ